jgi:F0F1-type ATP synthase assembly protein I
MLFMAGGWFLDRVLGIFPVFMVLGALLGAALGTLSIYRRLQVGFGEDEQSGEARKQ